MIRDVVSRKSPPRLENDDKDGSSGYINLKTNVELKMKPFLVDFDTKAKLVVGRESRESRESRGSRGSGLGRNTTDDSINNPMEPVKRASKSPVRGSVGVMDWDYEEDLLNRQGEARGVTRHADELGGRYWGNAATS